MHRKSTSNGAPSQHDSNNLKGVSLGELTSAVQAVQKGASWWELYGIDWCYIASGFAMIPPGLLLLSYPAWPPFLAGLILLGLFYGMVKTKMSHRAVHFALCRSKLASQFWQLFFVEFCGSFSAEYSMNAHIKIHYPYTNIIGLGDSSTWRVPFLPRYIYMFMAPLLLPAITPFAAMYFLLRCFIIVSLGLVTSISVLMYASGLTY